MASRGFSSNEVGSTNDGRADCPTLELELYIENLSPSSNLRAPISGGSGGIPGKVKMQSMSCEVSQETSLVNFRDRQTRLVTKFT